LKRLRQLIESVSDTLKGQVDLEQHGGPTFDGAAIRAAQRILAMAAAIWHNRTTESRSPDPCTTIDHIGLSRLVVLGYGVTFCCVPLAVEIPSSAGVIRAAGPADGGDLGGAVDLLVPRWPGALAH
jgi:hypothetical protein